MKNLSKIFKAALPLLCGVAAMATSNQGFAAPESTSSSLPCLVASWPMEEIVMDVVGANQPSSVAGLSFPPGKIGLGVQLALGGYVQIPHVAALANQQFTFEAWVRPDGIGPNNDSVGSVIMTKNKSGTFLYGLLW